MADESEGEDEYVEGESIDRGMLPEIASESTASKLDLNRIKEYNKRKLPRSVNGSLKDFHSQFLTLMKTQSFKNKISAQMIPGLGDRKSQPAS